MAIDPDIERDINLLGELVAACRDMLRARKGYTTEHRPEEKKYWQDIYLAQIRRVERVINEMDKDR